MCNRGLQDSSRLDFFTAVAERDSSKDPAVNRACVVTGAMFRRSRLCSSVHCMNWSTCLLPQQVPICCPLPSVRGPATFLAMCARKSSRRSEGWFRIVAVERDGFMFRQPLVVVACCAQDPFYLNDRVTGRRNCNVGIDRAWVAAVGFCLCWCWCW